MYQVGDEMFKARALTYACLTVPIITAADGSETNGAMNLSQTKPDKVLLADNESGWWSYLFGATKTGFVELHLEQKQLDKSTLFLDKADLSSLNSDLILLQLPTGQMSLANTAPGWTSWGRVEYCGILVRENRITSVVVVGANPPRCQCKNEKRRDPKSPGENLPVCQ